MIVALLLSVTVSALSVQCEAPSMDVYSPMVSFHCTFSEPAVLANAERVFVPNFVSVSPDSGMHSEFNVTAGVTDNTMGVITLLLGEGAFRTESETSPEYSVSVSCMV